MTLPVSVATRGSGGENRGGAGPSPGKAGEIAHTTSASLERIENRLI